MLAMGKMESLFGTSCAKTLREVMRASTCSSEHPVTAIGSSVDGHPLW